jgi:serine/threonine protein kinase
MSFDPPLTNEIKILFPQFDQIEFINVGGFKAVYKISTEGKLEAFKLVFIPQSGKSEISDEFRKESFARIKREIRILNDCKLPEIVRLGSIQPMDVQINGKDFVGYSEEFLGGDSLRSLINQNLKPVEQDIKLLLLSLLKAIREFWSLGVIHRDIKPENVIKVNNPGRCYVLIDLGIAFSVIDTPLTDPTNRIPGTFRYLAPEMLQPNFRDSLDFRSDMYAAALSAYEYAAGVHPLAINREDVLATLSRIAKETPKSLRAHRSDLSTTITQTIDQMLKKIPALRPSNLNLLIRKIEGEL